MNHPVVRHGTTTVTVDGIPVQVRIMLVKYDGCIEVYYQEENFPFEFSFGCAGCEGFKDVMDMAIRNAKDWGIHYDEL